MGAHVLYTNGPTYPQHLKYIFDGLSAHELAGHAESLVMPTGHTEFGSGADTAIILHAPPSTAHFEWPVLCSSSQAKVRLRFLLAAGQHRTN